MVVKSGNRDLVIWISFLIMMVITMVIIGGITRVTGSGLSMVEWRPLVGWLPPLDDQEWQRVFNLYKRSPEFISLNSWMDLSAFKEIFWWEYVHRLWGRMIGLAFFIPLVFFLISRSSFLSFLRSTARASKICDASKFGTTLGLAVAEPP